MMKKKDMNFRSLEEFWPFYMSQHSKPATRKWHFIGTFSGLLCLVYAILFNLWALFLMPLVGYGLAWYSHFYVEKNVPATFDYPVWSFICDYKMFALMLTGQMDKELKKLVCRYMTSTRLRRRRLYVLDRAYEGHIFYPHVSLPSRDRAYAVELYTQSILDLLGSSTFEPIIAIFYEPYIENILKCHNLYQSSKRLPKKANPSNPIFIQASLRTYKSYSPIKNYQDS